jgi:diaminopimelate epimerase
MRIGFTKMQGAGNDFVVLDETRGLLNLTPAQYRFLADRHFGVGADQILSVRPPPSPDVDFEYAIHNADGGEVEHCGNGARCFVRFVRERGLTDKTSVRVKVHGGVITLHATPDGQVTVDMGAPVFEPARVPFDPAAGGVPGAQPTPCGDWQVWSVPLAPTTQAPLAVVSMGNPHAVWRVDELDHAGVAQWGPLIERHPAFPQRVNAGFVQVLARDRVRLRVYERGVGETLACGTGACAAVVAGVRMGWLDAEVRVHTLGGVLTIAWDGRADLAAPVRMTGPATTVFTGEVDVPDTAPAA